MIWSNIYLNYDRKLITNKILYDFYMRKKILHIGLGKCGSTFLQKAIFPEIEKKTKIKFFMMHEIEEFKFIKGCPPLENIIQLEEKLPNDFILSHEGLFSHTWEFNKIQKEFEQIKKNFKNDTVIFLVLRNPYDLLNSIYVQNIMQMQISKPNKFFFIEKNNLSQKYRYNLDQFDYNILVSLYKNYFKKVVVVKYEELHELSYLKKLFNIDDKFLQYVKTKTNKTFNPSVSSFGINTFLFLNKFIDLRKNQNLIENLMWQSLSDYQSRNKYFYKIKYYLLSFLKLKELFQYKIDRIFTLKKYKINKEHIPLNLDKMIRDYNSANY